MTIYPDIFQPAKLELKQVVTKNNQVRTYYVRLTPERIGCLWVAAGAVL